jgi:hypothetical protein
MKPDFPLVFSPMYAQVRFMDQSVKVTDKAELDELLSKAVAYDTKEIIINQQPVIRGDMIVVMQYICNKLLGIVEKEELPILEDIVIPPKRKPGRPKKVRND